MGKHLKYNLAIFASLLDLAVIFIGGALLAWGIMEKGNPFKTVPGIVLLLVGLALWYPCRTWRVQTRRDVEYDEFGISKSKGNYEYLSKKERDQIDLKKTADMERLLSATALKKMTKPGSTLPMKDLQNMIGLLPVKQKIEEMVARMQFEQEENQQKGKKKTQNSMGSMGGRHMCFTGAPGTGKAQPLYSKVLTPNGFIQMGDIKVGDWVVTPNGDNARVLGVFPQGIKSIYELKFEDDRACRCCKEHLWNITSTLNTLPRTVELHEIIKNWDKDTYFIDCIKQDGTGVPVRLISVEYIGEEECQCIYIDHPDHLYITDDYIITHNTTVARIMTGFLYKYGYIKENKVIEIDGNFLKAGTESALKTELVVRSAYGGVLFIDEAYALMESGDGSGEQAIATLIKQMEDNRDKFILIIAGYTNEMKMLIDQNPGFESRIKEYLDFPDYDYIEMREIAQSMANQNNFCIDDKAYDVFDAIVARERKLRSFGNGRTVRNIVDKAIDRHTLNLARGVVPAEKRYTLCSEDFQNLKLGTITTNTRDSIATSLHKPIV